MIEILLFTTLLGFDGQKSMRQGRVSSEYRLFEDLAMVQSESAFMKILNNMGDKMKLTEPF